MNGPDLHPDRDKRVRTKAERRARTTTTRTEWGEQWSGAEVERLRDMLNRLGFCADCGDSMPCMTCGAGL